MWEFDGQNDSFLEGLLSTLQPSHVVPPDIGLLHDHSPHQLFLQFLFLGIIPFAVTIAALALTLVLFDWLLAMLLLVS